MSSHITKTTSTVVECIQIDDDEADWGMTSASSSQSFPVKTKRELDRAANDDGMDVSLPPPEWFDEDGCASPTLIPCATIRVKAQLKRKKDVATIEASGKRVALTPQRNLDEGKPKAKRRKKLVKKKKGVEAQKRVEEEEATSDGVSEGEDLDTALPVEQKGGIAKNVFFLGRRQHKLCAGKDTVNGGDWTSDDNDLMVLFESFPVTSSAITTAIGRLKSESASGSECVGLPIPLIAKYGVTSNADRRIMKIISGYRNQFPKEFNQFNKAIWAHLTTNLQNDHTFTWKMRVRQILHNQIRIVFPNSFLLAVGSTVNGCGAYNSDMDLCLGIPCPIEHFTTTKGYAAKYLRKVKRILGSLDIVRHIEYIPAKVPILKMNFAHPYSNLEVDINVNNIAGVYNSFLLHNYSRIDDRFPAVCLLVKHWAKIKGIGDASEGFLNSYSLILMVLHFLQCGVEPPVLPNLQLLYPDIFSCNRQFTDIKLFTDLPSPFPEIPQNDRTVGELLLAFFDYYNRFDFNQYAISIRRGCVFPRTELSPNTERFRLFIEEPFDYQNTARCVTSDDQWMTILDTFGNAARALSPSSNVPPDLLRIGIRS